VLVGGRDDDTVGLAQHGVRPAGDEAGIARTNADAHQ
jgi:hypothetical protein